MFGADCEGPRLVPQIYSIYSMSLDHSKYSTPSLSDLLKKLQIPAEYAQFEHMTSTMLELDRWKLDVHSVLEQILRLVKSDKELLLEEQGHIVFASSPFAIGSPIQSDQHEDTLDNWVTLDSHRSAQGIVYDFYTETI